jgi:peptidyl-tRNA hydrolase
LERAHPELVSAVQTVIEAFLEGGAGEPFQSAVNDLFIINREVGGRDGLTDAVLEFKGAYRVNQFSGAPCDISGLFKALAREQAAGSRQGDEAPVAASVAPEEPISDPTPYLYILMRNDLASMNPGKAVAQGSHAANQMIYEATIATDPMAVALNGPAANGLADLVQEWSTAARGFGTCIVLGVNEAEMRATVEAAKAAGIHAGITHDPSYPVRDGDSFYTVPLDTCGYVFARKCDAAPFVKNFRLLP